MDSSSILNEEHIVIKIEEVEESYKSNQKKIDKKDHTSKYSCCSCHHNSATLVRLTCEGNINEPNFSRRLKKLVSRLKSLLSNDKKPFKVTKVEPWNSVRVTFNLSQDAAQRLRQLAVDGDDNLRNLGILSVQIEGQQVISLRLDNQNNASNTNNEVCNRIEAVSNNISNDADTSRLVPLNKDLNNIKESTPNRTVVHEPNKYLYDQFNGAIGDESCDSKNSHSTEANQLSITDNRSIVHNQIQNSYYLESTQGNSKQHSHPIPSSSSLPPSYDAKQQQEIYLSQMPRPSNSLLLQSNQNNPNGQVKANFHNSSNTSNFDQGTCKDSSILLKKSEPGLVQNVSSAPVMIHQVCVQQKPFTTNSNVMQISINKSLPSNQSCVGSNSLNIRNVNLNQFNGPRTIVIPSSSHSQQVFISSQKSVPHLQSQPHSIKPTDNLASSLSQSSIVVDQNSKPLDPIVNQHYVNSNSTSIQNSMYQSVSANVSNQQIDLKKSNEHDNPPETSELLNQGINTGDILGASADAVDDEELLASVGATGANSLDINNLKDLNDFTLLSMLNEIESPNTSQPNTISMDSVNSNASSSSESNIVSDCNSAPSSASLNVNEDFPSPNVVAPQSTQPLPFFVAQHQQASTKMGSVASTGQQSLNSSSPGTVLNQSQAHHLSKQLISSVSSGATSFPVSSTIYPFTSMQHASLFNAKQQLSQPISPSPRHVILPVRQIPAVRASASQQQPSQQSQPQTVQITRSTPSSVTSADDLLIQQSKQQNLFRPGQIIRQPLPNVSNASSMQSTPQFVIRPYSTSQQSSNAAGQQNTVALSSPLLVNLLKPQQQQPQQYVTQAGNQQIQIIRPPSQGGDTTQMMMMVQVSSAPQGTTAQLINPATGNVVATSISSQVERQSSTVQSNESSTPNTKPKKPRKPRKPKNSPEKKAEGSVQPGINLNAPITSGAPITSIPISLATSSRIQTNSPQVSNIFTFPTSSIAQTLKLQTSKPQQTLSGQSSEQHLFNKKSRVQPVVKLSNANLLNYVSSESNLPVSTSIVQTSPGRFFFTNVAPSSLSGNTSTTFSTTTTGVQLGGNRKIFLATKSNSFPVSSALSSGGIVARIPNSPSSSSLVSSPMKMVSQNAPIPASVSIIVSSNSSSSTRSGTTSKSSPITSIASSTKTIVNNLASFTSNNVSIVSASDLSTLSKSLLQSPTTINSQIKMAKPVSQTCSSSSNSSQFLITSSKSSNISTSSIPIKNFQIPHSPLNTNSLLLNKLNQSGNSTILTSSKVLTSSIPQFQIAVPVSQLHPSLQKHVLTVQKRESICEDNVDKSSTTSSTSDNSFSTKITEKSSTSVQDETVVSKCESLESLLSSGSNDNKHSSDTNPKFNLSLVDMLNTDTSTSKTISSFSYEKSDSQSVSDQSSSITLSTGFMNRQNVPQSNELNTQEVNTSSVVEFNSKLDKKPLMEQMKQESSKLDSYSPVETTTVNSQTVSTTSSNTITPAKSIAELNEPSSTPSLQKSNDDAQNKPNCAFDSFSYYLSNHSYSQALPDHILDDDDDGDSDIDDFGLYPKTSHLLSGSIGSIGGNQNQTSSSTTNTSSSAVTTSNSTPSATTSNTKVFVKSNSLESILNSTNRASISSNKSVKTLNLMTDSKSYESLSNKDLTDPSIQINAHAKSMQKNVSIHTLINGDISPNLIPQNSKSEVILSDETKISVPNSNQSNISKAVPASLVASKSYPSQFISSTNTESKDLNTTSVSTRQFLNLSDNVDSSATSSDIQTPLPTKSPKASIPKSSSSTPNKNRRKATSSVSTMSQTVAVSESLFQTQNSVTKSELHSLLSTTTPITAKSNITSFTPNESVNSSVPSASTNDSNQTTSVKLIAFKQSHQQQPPTSTNLIQNISSQSFTHLDSTTSLTNTNSPTTKVVKVILPQSIQNLSGNKLLALSGANTSTCSNAGQILTQSLANSISQANANADASSFNQSVTPVLGRYIVAGPRGQSFSQLLVVKSLMMNKGSESGNVSSGNNPQVKFIATTPNKSLSSSSSSTSHPLIIPMVSNSINSTFSTKTQTKTQVISSNEQVQVESSVQASANLASGQVDQDVIEIENPNVVARKNSQSSLFSDSTKVAVSSSLSVSPQISSTSDIPTTNFVDNRKDQTSKSDTVEVQSVDLKKCSTTNENDQTIDSNMLPETSQISQDLDYSSQLKEDSHNEANISPDNAVSQSIETSLVESVESIKTTEDCSNNSVEEIKIDSQQSQQIALVENSSKPTPVTDEGISQIQYIQADNLVDSLENPKEEVVVENEANPMAIEPERSVYILNDDLKAKPTVPQTVHLMLPNTDSISSSTSSNSNVVILKTESSKSVEEPHIVQLNLANSPNNSPNTIRRPIFITKPTIVSQSNVNQLQQPSQDLNVQPNIFATKSTGAAITATKTLPSILRQSKRKTEQIYHHPPTSQVSSSEHNIKLHQAASINYSNQATVDYAESTELEIQTTTKQTEYVSHKPNSILTVMSSINDDENNSDATDSTAVSIVPKPRKRARKSKVTMIQPPANDCDLSKSILIADNDSTSNEVEGEQKLDETSPTSRVLRNSNPSPVPQTKPTAKRAQRNNRSMLAQNSVGAVVSLPSPDSALKTGDKLRKAREPQNVAARQTRSNRTRSKKPDDIVSSTPEILITDNAIDEETIDLDAPKEIESNITLTPDNGMIRQATTSLIINQMPVMSYSVSEPRTISLLESGNSNSSTASNSSSNSLLLKRPRKSLTSSTKPSLRSNATSETLSLPITPTKRRRLAKELSK